MADRITWASFYRVSAEDVINVLIQDARDPNTVEVVLQARMDWWKQIQLEDARRRVIGQVWTQDANRGPNSFVRPVSVLPGARLIFWKAKWFGVHTGMYELVDLDRLVGKRITFIWERDVHENGPIAGFFSDLSHGVGQAAQGVATVVSTVVNGFAAAVNAVLSIFGITRLLATILNVLATLLWALVNIVLDVGLTLTTFQRPEKLLRFSVIVQLDESDAMVANIGKVEKSVQFAIGVFKDQANVRLIPATGERFDRNAPIPPDRFIVVENDRSEWTTLDVACGTTAWRQDLGLTGSAFAQKMIQHQFRNNLERLGGYGAPLAVFAVRTFADPQDAGCSLGPLSDYVTVAFDRGDNSTMAHELGHACNLSHLTGNNLMTENAPHPPVLALPQVLLVRASRHVAFW